MDPLLQGRQGDARAPEQGGRRRGAGRASSRRRTLIRGLSLLASALAGWALISASAAQVANDRPSVATVEVVRTFPHDTGAFTQGLFFSDGRLYESTGKRGASKIRRLNLRTGGAVGEVALPDDIFGEGATAVGDRIVSLSWTSGQGFVHDLETLERTGTFTYEGEGWGLAYDGDRLALSDGTATLRFLDPETYAVTETLEVTLGGRPLSRLNELEWVEGELWANIWQEDVIARIDPASGAVTGLIDVSSLLPAAQRRSPTEDVPNGIAYDPRTKRLFLTGKNWPQIFEVTLRERAG